MKLGNKLKKVNKAKLDNFKVYLEFVDGDKGILSLDSIFSKPKNQAAEILVGQMFELCLLKVVL